MFSPKTWTCGKKNKINAVEKPANIQTISTASQLFGRAPYSLSEGHEFEYPGDTEIGKLTKSGRHWGQVFYNVNITVLNEVLKATHDNIDSKNDILRKTVCGLKMSFKKIPSNTVDQKTCVYP